MTDPVYRQLLDQTLAAPGDAAATAGAVICLCAEWCGVCREFRSAFEQAARAHPQLRFRWLDVEDEADALDDLDVETFPTLVIGSATTLHFAGPTLPQAAQLERLLRPLAGTATP